MKANAIIRIIIYLVVIILLCCLLAFALRQNKFTLFHFSSNRNYSEGGASVSAAEIRNLQIDWAAGEIMIQTIPDTDQITFSESGSIEKPMGYAVEGDTLYLSFHKESLIQLGFTVKNEKTLKITVPENWDFRRLSIDSASSDATVENLTIGTVDLDSASNNFRFTDCSIGGLDIDGASNTLDIRGTVEKMDCDGMSTKITAVLEQTPESIDLDGMSTVMELTLPKDCGFHVTMDGLSNRFYSDFDSRKTEDAYIFGDQSCRIDVDGMSSEVRIYSAQ